MDISRPVAASFIAFATTFSGLAMKIFLNGAASWFEDARSKNSVSTYSGHRSYADSVRGQFPAKGSGITQDKCFVAAYKEKPAWGINAAADAIWIIWPPSIIYGINISVIRTSARQLRCPPCLQLVFRSMVLKNSHFSKSCGVNQKFNFWAAPVTA